MRAKNSSMTEIKLYKSPWKALKLLALTILFVCVGAWIISKGNSISDRFWGWASVCFFGLGLPISIFNLFDRRPQIIINETGIFDRTIQADFIDWQLIKKAYPVNIYGQKFICLKLKGEFKPSKKKNFIRKKLAQLNVVLGYQEININLGQIRIDVHKLTDFIIAMSKTIPAERNDRLEMLSKKHGF